MKDENAVERDRHAEIRKQNRAKYVAAQKRYKAESLDKRITEMGDLTRYYSREEKLRFFRDKLERVATNAKQRGKEFNIALEDVQLPDRCPVLGIPLDYGWPVSNLGAVPSIDRIDNEKGYIYGNVIVISHRANKLKGDASKAEMVRAALFWLGFYAADMDVFARLGELPPKGVAMPERTTRYEARKAYWREYQKRRYQEKKAKKAALKEEGI